MKLLASNWKAIAIVTFSPLHDFSVPLHQVPIVGRNTQTQNFMQIKGMNGENYSVTGMGQGNLNTVLGAIGAAGALGNGNGLLGGLFGGNCNYRNQPVEVITSDDKPITRNEAKMMQELSAKDSEISLLKADKYTDQKIVETTAYLMNKINEVSAEVRANKDAQTAVNMEQAVYNGTNTATIGCIKQQIAQLQALSELVVPQRKVCDTCCNCGC